MSASLALTGPILGVVLALGGAPQVSLPQAAPDLRPRIQKVLFRLQNQESPLQPLLEKLASDAQHSISVPADEGFPFLREANAATLAAFPDMPQGFRLGLESAQQALAGLGDAQGRAVLVHANLVLAEEEERFSAQGYPLVRAVLAFTLQRGRLNRLNLEERLSALVATLEYLVSDATLFTDEFQQLGLATALASREGIATSFLKREMLYRAVSALIQSDAGEPALFHRMAWAAGQIHLDGSALACLRHFAEVGAGSPLIQPLHRSFLQEALRNAAAAGEPAQARAILDEVFASLAR